MNVLLTGAVAVFFALMGLVGLAVPERLAATFQIPLPTPSARSEIRAVYGGFGLAVAGALFYALSEGGELGRGIRMAFALALAGMAGGRVVGFFFEPPRKLYPLVAFGLFELLMAAALFFPRR